MKKFISLIVSFAVLLSAFSMISVSAAGTKTYYLFGYINGADYADKDDAANMGEYRFVNNQITVCFDRDTYVGVKEEGNANWYMTNGWQGMDVTSVTLYNTNDLGKNADKMYIPSNVQLTLHLDENSDGTLTLWYDPADLENTIPTASSKNTDPDYGYYGGYFEALQILIAQYSFGVADCPENYTPESFAVFKEAYDYANSLYSDNIFHGEAVYEEAYQRLLDAKNSLVRASFRNKLMMLAAEYSFGVADSPENYTPESFKVFREAYDYANKLLSDSSATDAQYEGAYIRLLNARNSLVTVRAQETREKLSQLVDEYSYGVMNVGMSGFYTWESFEVFRDVYHSAEKVLWDDSSTYAQLEEAYTRLLNAYKSLVREDLTPEQAKYYLSMAISESSNIPAGGAWTKESWEAYISASSYANNTYSDENATVDQIMQAAYNVLEAQHNLEPFHGDKAELWSLIEKLEEVLARDDAESLPNYNELKDLGLEALVKYYYAGSQEELDECRDKLKAALSALGEIEETTNPIDSRFEATVKLSSKIQKAKAIVAPGNAHLYTPESLRRVWDAIDYADELLRDGTSTVEEMLAQIEVLQRAIDALEENETTNPTESEELTQEEIEAGYIFGSVIVSMKYSYSLGNLLDGFEIEETRLLTPGSSNMTVYLVKFKEKTKEIVWRAIEVLKQSPYVQYAEPDYLRFPAVVPPSDATEREKLMWFVSRCTSFFDEVYENEEVYKAFIKEYENAKKLLSDENATDEQLAEMRDVLLNARDNWIRERSQSSTKPSESTNTPTATDPTETVTKASDPLGTGEYADVTSAATDPTESEQQNTEIAPAVTDPTETTSDEVVTDPTEVTEPTSGEVVTDPTETAQPTVTSEPTSESTIPTYTEPVTEIPNTTETPNPTENTDPDFTEQPTEPNTESSDTTEPSETTDQEQATIQPTTTETEPTNPDTDSAVTAKKANKIKVTVKDKTVKVKKLKNSKVKLNAVTVKKANGKVTFKKVAKKSSNRLRINKKGKIIVKKGTKKGNYKIKVKITAKGNKKFKKKTVTKVIKIKVRK